MVTSIRDQSDLSSILYPYSENVCIFPLLPVNQKDWSNSNFVNSVSFSRLFPVEDWNSFVPLNSGSMIYDFVHSYNISFYINFIQWQFSLILQVMLCTVYGRIWMIPTMCFRVGIPHWLTLAHGSMSHATMITVSLECKSSLVFDNL